MSVVGQSPPIWRRGGEVPSSPHSCHAGVRRTVTSATRRANHHSAQLRPIRSHVKSLPRKYSSSAFRKSMITSPHPASTRRGVATVTDVGSGERWTRWCRQASGIEADERSRAVLIPRRWDQPPGHEPGGTEAKEQGTPGRPRISRKPSRRERRLFRLPC
jgi:hypothetical protein